MADLPSYCLTEASDSPVKLHFAKVVVPACQNGHHDDHEVGVYMGGSGLPLVVAHGYTAHSRIYLLLLGLLARWFKVIAIDLAGHGSTKNLPRQASTAAFADLLVCTLQELGVRRAILVGHSLGGRVVAEAASRHPGVAAALIMVNAIVGEPWDRRIASFGPVAMLRPLRAVKLIAGLAGDMVNLACHICQTDHEPTLIRLSADTYIRHITHPWRLVPAGMAILGASPSADILHKIAAAKIPTIVVWGENDPVLTSADAHSAARLSHGELVVVKRAGHSWPLADRRSLPEIIQKELRDGTLGKIIAEELKHGGLEPNTATPLDVEQATSGWYTPGAAVLRGAPRSLSGGRGRYVPDPRPWRRAAA